MQAEHEGHAMSNDLTLWGIGTSRTMRPHWMLIELGLEYESRPIAPRTGETLSDEYKRLNPRHKIPLLQHGSFAVTESAAIVNYLGEVFPKPERMFVPRDAAERARLAEWCYFIMTELDAASLYIVRRHEGLKETYGEAPVAVEAAKNYFMHNLEAMDSRIGEASYLLGEQFSAADILMMTCLEWAVTCNLQLPSGAAAYRERIARRPAYLTALRKNFPRRGGGTTSI
jgi:glutathione S-transferase